MNTMRIFGLGLILFAFLSLAVGCGQREKANKEVAGIKEEARKANGKMEEDGHTHGAGPHGGALAHWGGGKLHVEFVVDHDKEQATVHVLGADEKTSVPIKAKGGQILLSIDEPKFQVPLKAAPLKGESEEAASRFVGRHKNLGIHREFSGTITGVDGSTPYTGRFKEEPEGK